MESLLLGSLFLCCLSVVQGSSLVISHKPDYLDVAESSESVKLSDVQHILSGIHGFVAHKEVNFHGIFTPNPFNHPKASAVLSVHNGEAVVNELPGYHIGVKADEDYLPVNHLIHSLRRFYEKESNIYELHLDTKVSDLDGSLGGLTDDAAIISKSISAIFDTSAANVTSAGVKRFLRDVSLILQGLDVMKKGKAGRSDLIGFEIKLPSGTDDLTRKSLDSLTNALIKQINSVMVELYGDNCLVIVVGLPDSDKVLKRKTRSLLAEEKTLAEKFNVATVYTEDFPAMFHIILWLVVFMALVVTYAMYGMMTMDPGSDSIIYRMTTTRLKKD